MRALYVWCSAVVFAIGGSGAWGEQTAAPASDQFASCPTVLPIAEGERSIVVPTIAPHVEAPRIASRPLSTEHAAAQSLLREKLAERDRLQREIATLREKTQTPEQIVVRLKLMEVNRTKVRQLGLDLSTSPQGNNENVAVAALLGQGATSCSYTNVDNAALGIFEALQRRNLSKLIAESTVVTVDGHPAAISMGGEFPIPMPQPAGGVKIQKYGRQLDVTAVALRDNKVRLRVCPRVSELDASKGIAIEGQQVPGLRVRELDTSFEVEVGKSAVLSGIVQQRVESVMTPSGVQTEMAEFALVIVVTPEFVR